METKRVEKLTTHYADLHIHIGRSKDGLPVKITASNQMTFTEIVAEAYHRKGLQLIGVIDAHSPPVQQEILQGLEAGIFEEHPDGGIQYHGVTCLLGVEIELQEGSMRPFHVLVYLPFIADMIDFSNWLSKYMKNIQLSTQRLYRSSAALVEQVFMRRGVLIPAHIFTPFKSVLGSAADRLADLFSPEAITAVELGLSSDTSLADRVAELHAYPYLTNSDAHSLLNIGREYNELLLKEASFAEWLKALKQMDGRQVVANYGLNPKLGKYYRSRCRVCDHLWPVGLKTAKCPQCGGEQRVKGVRDRIEELAAMGKAKTPPPIRPPYIHQIPLPMLPKLGKKTLEKLYNRVGTEMEILHQASFDEIAAATSERIAQQILLAREQRLNLIEGGGGKYGRVQGSEMENRRK